MQWNLKSKTTVLKTVPFAVEELLLEDSKSGKSPNHPYYRCHSPDWVNIVPIMKGGDIMLIKQSRVGVFEDCLELPGGVIDEGEDSLVAAKRELEEETGLASKELIKLGEISPNPAIMTNKLHMFVALNCYTPDQRQNFPDEFESLEGLPYPTDQIATLLNASKINNALCALTLYMASKYWASP